MSIHSQIKKPVPGAAISKNKEDLDSSKKRGADTPDTDVCNKKLKKTVSLPNPPENSPAESDDSDIDDLLLASL